MTWLTRWFGAASRATRRPGRAARHTSWARWNRPNLALESLENRDLLSFAAPLNFPVGPTPLGVVAADFNHDGRPDLATANGRSPTVSVLLGTGHGRFTAPHDYAVGAAPRSLAVADLTGTGGPDLVTANGNGTVGVLLGNGDGTFQPVRTFPAGDINVNDTSVAVGDVNGDGLPDVVVGNTSQNDSVSVLLGNGDGSFRAPIKVALGRNVSSVAVGDVNGDGRLDVLAVVDDPAGLHSTVTVLTSNGDGTLQLGASYDIGDVSLGARTLAAADVNSDGTPDFVVATVTDLRVFLGNGDGAFRAAGTYNVTAPYGAVTIADLSGDHHPDLAVTAVSGVAVLPGTGDGTFGAPQRVLTAGIIPTEAAVADFTGDGNADLAVVSSDSDVVSLLQGRGDGSFRTAPTYPLPAGVVVNAATVADLNQDGVPDLVAAASNGVNVLPGNGDGTFGPPVTYLTVPFFSPTSVVAADVNGDGIPDLVATGPGYRASGNAVYVLLGTGDGSFQAPRSFTVPFGPQVVTAADLNGDGNLDLVVASPASFPVYTGHTISVLLGNGDGSFQPAVSYDVGTAPTAVVVADLNGDGASDLVVSYAGNTAARIPGGVDVLLGNGDGMFQPASTLVSGFTANGVVAGDFTGDGLPDLAVADGSDGLVRVYPGNGDGTFQAPQDYAVGRNPMSLAAGDFNANGRLDLAVAGPFGVHLLTGKANSTFRVAVASFGPAATFVAVGDLNGDGLPDLLTNNALLINRGHAHAAKRTADTHRWAPGDAPARWSFVPAPVPAPNVRPGAQPTASPAARAPARAPGDFTALRSEDRNAVGHSAPHTPPAAAAAAGWAEGAALDGVPGCDLDFSRLPR